MKPSPQANSRGPRGPRGPVETAIEAKLRETFEPLALVVTNESHMHAVGPGAETHFRVYVVSRAFEGQRAVQRHQAIYAALAQERADGVHALGMQTLTPDEYQASGQEIAESPPCLGGDNA